MQDNFSVTGSMNPMTDDNKAAAQVILAKLLEIYDVKTLVAYLNGVGENRWSPAIFKRVVANETWHRLSDNEFTYLNSLLPTPPAHHPHYAFRLSICLPALADSSRL
jgi:DNA (cytosine-5)-methyltransferase 1